MIPLAPKDTREIIRGELESARTAFHALLDALSEDDLHKKSLNPGWTNGEILFHVTFAFMILLALVPLLWSFGHLPRSYSKLFARLLDGMAGLFNWINALGARMGGRIYKNKKSIGKKYDKVYSSVLKKLNSVKDSEWQLGMYYPAKWDALFHEYMTLEDVFHYPAKHFEFHTKQLARRE